MAAAKSASSSAALAASSRCSSFSSSSAGLVGAGLGLLKGFNAEAEGDAHAAALAPDAAHPVAEGVVVQAPCACAFLLDAASAAMDTLGDDTGDEGCAHELDLGLR